MPKRRTAKQKAATRKLVALNKSKRKGTTKGMVRKTARRAFEGKRNRQKPSVNRQVQIEERQSKVWQNEDVLA